MNDWGRHLLKAIIGSGTLVFASQPLPAETRVWTSSAGSTLSADFLGMKDGLVQLKSASGKLLTVPPTQLSEADQAYLAQATAASAVEPTAPEKESDDPFAAALAAGAARPNSATAPQAARDLGSPELASNTAAGAGKPRIPNSLDLLEERVVLALEGRDMELATYYLQGGSKLAQSETDQALLAQLNKQSDELRALWEALPGICTTLLQAGATVQFEEKSLSVVHVEEPYFVLDDGQKRFTFSISRGRDFPSELVGGLVRDFLKIEPSFKSRYELFIKLDGAHRDPYRWKMAQWAYLGQAKPSTVAANDGAADALPTAKARLPMPGESVIDARRNELREVFQAEIAEARKPEQRAALARQFLEKARRPDTTAPATTAALLLEGAELLMQAGQVVDSWRTLDRLGEIFEVPDVLERKIKLTEKVTAPPPSSEATKIAELSLAMFDELEARGSYSVAETLGKMSAAAARLSQSRPLIDQVAARSTRHKEAQKKYLRVEAARKQLLESPADGGAHHLMGSYLCFDRDQWPEGLPHLARGNVPEMAEAARRELLAPEVAGEQLALADAWWKLAETNPAHARPLTQHAVAWYEKAVPQLSGIERLRAGKRIDDAKAAAQRTATAGSPRVPATGQLPEE